MPQALEEIKKQTVSEEIKKMEHQPLLPAEKKLIAGSLILGVALLGILIWISQRFFPG
jgi:hypothetical protein